MMDEFPEILQAVCSYLNEKGIDYVVVGGIAVMYHGVPRTTVDIDILFDIEYQEIEPLSDFLKSEGFDASPEDIRTAMAEQSHSTVFYRSSLLRLDIQGINTEFDRMTLNRAITVELFDTRIIIGSAEDTIVNKILFQGEQDLRDALGIFERNRSNLDLDYIESTCEMLGIVDRWKSFLAEYDE
jgi:hypothetical protein